MVSKKSKQMDIKDCVCYYTETYLDFEQKALNI